MIAKFIAGFALACVVQTAYAQPLPQPGPDGPAQPKVTRYSQCLHGRINHRLCQCGTDKSQDCGPTDFCDFRGGAGTCLRPKAH